MQKNKLLLSLLVPLVTMSGFSSRPAQAEGEAKSVAIVLCAAGIAARIVHNWWQIEAIHRKTSESTRNAAMKFYQFAASRYPTAAYIRKDKVTVVNDLKAAIYSRKLIVFDAFGAQLNPDEVTDESIVRTLEQEQKELLADMQYLDDTFTCCGYFDLFKMQLRGIERGYEKACDAVKVGYDQAEWSIAQAGDVDQRMNDNECATPSYWFLPIPYIGLKWHYEKAAKEWWRLRRLHDRHDELKSIVRSYYDETPAVHYVDMQLTGESA